MTPNAHSSHALLIAEITTLRTRLSEAEAENARLLGIWTQAAIHRVDGSNPDWKEVEKCATGGHVMVDPPCSGESATLLLGRALKAEAALREARVELIDIRFKNETCGRNWHKAMDDYSEEKRKRGEAERAVSSAQQIMCHKFCPRHPVRGLGQLHGAECAALKSLIPAQEKQSPKEKS